MSDGVIRGRIRVDARRAVAKLREHQLVDLHHYTHEVARAAVASGAGRIDVAYDADDVVISWQADPLPPGVSGRLLDHVLTEADDAAGRRLRLLAMGVNAALGLSPTFVDLYAVDPDGVCVRARWTPALLTGADDVAPEEETVPTPSGLGAGATRVHVRRRLGWDVLRRATLGGLPREVLSLVAAAGCLRAELVVGGEVLPKPPPPVLELPLHLDRTLAPGLGARLEILASAEPSPALLFVEQGIELARYELDPHPAFPREPHGDLHLPVQVVVSADQLPTNASRSAIREDSSLAHAVARAAEGALVDAVEALASAAVGDGELPASVTRLSEDPRAVDEALGAFVSVVVAAHQRGQALSDEARRLRELPVLVDGLGRPTSYAAIRAGDEQTPLYLHRGEPLDEALAPWLRDVVLVRDRRAERALSTYHHRDAAPLVKHATAGIERREAFLAHEPTAVAVPPSAEHVLVKSFEVGSGPFTGLMGEVALRATPTGRTTVRVFFERREIAVQHLAAAVSTVPLDVALAWDDRVRVRFGFDGVEDDRTLRSAIWYALQIGVDVVRDALRRLTDEAGVDPADVRAAAWVRGALRLVHRSWSSLQLPETHRRLLGPDDPLRAVPAWPLTDGGHATTAELRDLVEQRSALCHAEARRARARDGRLVLALDADDRSLLGEVLGRDLVWVPYDRAMASSEPVRAQASREALDGRLDAQRVPKEGRLVLPFERPGVRGLVAVAAQAERVVSHAGHPLTTALLPRRYGPVVIVADDDTIVPAPDWRGIAWSGKTWAPPSVEHELLVTVMAALEGDAEAQRRLGGDVRPATLGEVGRRYLALSFAALEQQLADEQDEARASELVHLSARAVDLPVFRMIAESGRARWVSTGDILDAHGSQGPVPTLCREPAFPTYDWRPLLVDGDEERAALREWFGGRLAAADQLVAARRERAAAETRRRELLARPTIDPFRLDDLAPDDGVTGRHESAEGSACVALRPAGAHHTVVDLAYQRRPVLRDVWHGYPLPVVARVSLASHGGFEEDFGGVTEEGRATARRLVARAAGDLVRARLTAEDGARAMLDTSLLSLVSALFGPAGPEDEHLLFGDLLLRVARWPTVQGGTCRLAEARRGRGEIYVGRVRYEPWREAARPGALDRAVVYVGSGVEGALHEQILVELKVDRRDVTDAVDALQRRRAAGEEDATPKLSGEPAHPALRASLDELGKARGLVGEIELVDGPPRLVIGDLSGPARDATTHPETPVHAVIWTETVASDERDARIAKRIDRLARRLIARVARVMTTGERGDLPPLVAGLLRRQIGAGLVAEREIEPELRAAPVFRDTEDRWHSLEALEGLKGRQKPIWTTSGEPPYPERDDGRVIVRLGDEERLWLRRALPLRNMTTVLARTVEGDRRRSAEPIAELVLAPELQRACLWVGAGDADGMAGEIGILAPEAIGLRGIVVHHGRRPLCRLDDRPGWPIGAVVNDDQIRPNPFFDGPRQIEDGDACVARVRELADALLERVLVAPEGAAASHFVDAEDRQRGLRVKGRLWLEMEPLANPSVTLLSAGERTGRAEMPLARLHGPEGLDRTVPVSGTLFVEHLPRGEDGAGELLKLAVEMAGGDASHHYVTELALEAAAAMVDELAGVVPDADHERMRWTLALLAAPLSEPPVAVTTEGEVSARAVRDELGERQVLWHATGRGDADGAFPGTAPRFVLVRNENQGLLAALEARSLRPLLREVGGSDGPKPRPPRRRPRRSSGAPAEAASWVELDLDQPLVDPWFSGLVSTVRGWFAGVEPAPATLTLRGAIEVAIGRLALPEGPVESVGFSRRGRAVRYQKSNKRLVINRDHPAILTLVPADGQVSDLGMRLLLAAIVSELNRAHEAVTGATELEALRFLLETEKL